MKRKILINSKTIGDIQAQHLELDKDAVRSVLQQPDNKIVQECLDGYKSYMQKIMRDLCAEGIRIKEAQKVLDEIDMSKANKGGDYDIDVVTIVAIAMISYHSNSINLKGMESSGIEKYYEKLRKGEVTPNMRSDVSTEEIAALREQKYTYDQIAYMLGISRSTVINRLKKQQNCK